MADVALSVPAERQRLKQLEFYSFCVVSFVGKSILLIGLPYRDWPVNTFYTCSLLLFFYLYFRFRQGMRAPFYVLLALGSAVAVDILGNQKGLYGHPFGPLRDYDEFAHFAGSGLSAIAAFWLLRAGTLKMGVRLKPAVLTFLATTVAFAYCGWYEILELWDEWYWSHFERIHSWDDTPNDLFYDFLGVIVVLAVAGVVVALVSRREQSNLKPVGMTSLAAALPKDLLTVFIVTTTFGLAAWFEIFRMFDQIWSGRAHFVGFEDCAIRLQWELAACVTLGLICLAALKLSTRARQGRRDPL